MKCILFVVVLLSCSAFAQHPIAQPYQAAHDATHEIKEWTVLNNDKCSSTAIAPHALLTASHCILADAMMNVDDKEAVISKVINDGYDHTIILLAKPEFTSYVPITVRQVKVGEDIFMFGNPAQFDDLMRKGYLAGWRKNGKNNDEMIFDVNSFGGDSGSGIFDDTGALVAMASSRFQDAEDPPSFFMMGSWPFHFSKGALKEAEEFK